MSRESGDLPNNDRAICPQPLVSTEGDMTATVQSRSISFTQRLAVGVSAMFLGSFVIFGVGLAQDARLHNAAHDTRHAIGFPCH